MLLNEHSRGAAGRNRPLNMNTLMKEDIPIANEEYQEQLRQFLDQERGLARQIADEIALVQEFRASLIADVVTGQLDVRGVAVNLPDLVEVGARDDLTDEVDLDDADALNEEDEAA